MENRHYFHRIKARPRTSNINLLPNGQLMLIFRDDQQVPIMALSD